ncbi:MAG: HAMP domain-containing histidine kinase [Ignavibacteriae bacterium]|nr:HAMP domain-containing histidine kinase [Ignavibacteriota bacterium]
MEQFLISGFDENEYGIAFIAKVKMLNQVCIVGILIAIILGTSAFLKNYIIIGIIDITLALFLIFIVYYLRKSHKYNLLSILSVIITGSLFFYLFVTGGVENTGHLWYYTFPLFSFFLIDSRKGSIATSGLLILAILFFLFQNNFPSLTKYPLDLMMRFVPTYLVVFLLSYFFEKLREKTYCLVNSKNEELSNTITKLEKNEKELKKLHDELEQRVAERTTELFNANEQLVEEVMLKNKATIAAESAVKMKTEFLAQMSHEIRTPVNSILSYAQLLKEETIDKVPEDLKFSFDMINNGGQRLIRTIDLILNMSELQTGTYDAIMEESDIVEIIEPLVKEFQTTAKVKDLDLIFINRLEKDEAIFCVDIYTITQILVNLMHNALKYTVEGSIEVIAYKTKENLCCVDIQDTGIGISKEFQKTLFEPFTQEEQGYTRKFEGNGLGMALVKEYCNINNIQISVKSEKDKGSVFTLVLPQKESNEETPSVLKVMTQN